MTPSRAGSILGAQQATEPRLADPMSNYLPLAKTVISLSSCFAFLSENLKAVLQPFGPFPLAREVSETSPAPDPSDLEDRGTGRGRCRAWGRADSRGHLGRPPRQILPMTGRTEQLLPGLNTGEWFWTLPSPSSTLCEHRTGLAAAGEALPPLRTKPRDRHRRSHTERTPLAQVLPPPPCPPCPPPPPPRGSQMVRNGHWL